jgi:hypothetical protein
MKRLIPFTLLLLSMSVTSCKQKYAQGFAAGQASRDGDVTNAYNDGYQDGSDDAWEAAEAYFANADYSQGFADGEAQGYDNGYSDGIGDGYDLGYGDGLGVGYDLGYSDGVGDGYDLGYGDGFGDGSVSGTGGYTQGDLNNAYDNGYSDGYGDGLDDGLVGSATAIADAYNDGYGDGYGDGYLDGDYDGYNLGFGDGYNVGFDDGYVVGYDDGYYDGYWGLSSSGKVVATAKLGLPHNNAKNLNPKVQLANTLANDLIDFSKMAKDEAKLLKELKNKTVAFDETIESSNDIQKLAAVKEQFRLKAASEQIKARFGLSVEASKNIASLAHTYRKAASTRAITAADSEAFTKNLIGADLKEVEAAYKKAIKGEFSNLKSLVEKAATVNKTSPEKMAKVMFELFI